MATHSRSRVRDAPVAEERRPILNDDEPNYDSIHDSRNGILPADKNKLSKGDLVWVMTGLFATAFLNGLDATIVATLQTPIGSYFDRAHQASYLGTSYLLSICCFTPLYGRLSDILGRKGAILLAVTLFGAGTMLCAAAPTMHTLIAARAVAGMGGGGLGTVAFIITADVVSLKDRGIYQGLSLLFWSIGAALGGPIGGFMNDKFGWHSSFSVQLPVIVLSFAILAWKVKITPPATFSKTQTALEKFTRIDWAGSFTLVICVGSLLLALSLKTTEEYPWDHPVVATLLAGSVVFAMLFFLAEKHWAVEPVMPLRLLVQRTPLFVSLTSFFMSMPAFVTIYSIPLYFAAVRLQSASDSGLHLLPFSASVASGSILAGWIMRQTGKLWWPTVFSYILNISACVLIAGWTERTAEYHLWLDVALSGLGGSSVTTTVITAIISAVPKEDVAVAMGISFLFRTTAQVIGVSCSGILVQDILLRSLRKRITGPGSAEMIERIRHSSLIVPTLEPELRKAAVDSYDNALRAVFLADIGLALIGLLCCLPIQEFAFGGAPKPPNDEEHRSGPGADTH